MSFYDVLIIEPEQAIRDVLADLLIMEGVLVATVEDSHQAIEFLKENKAKLILLDYNSIRLNDGQLFLDKKAKDPEICCIPVVIMTTNPQTLEKLKIPILNKPFDISEFLNYIANCSEK
jgi:DNA-binding NtrC family response regulator